MDPPPPVWTPARGGPRGVPASTHPASSLTPPHSRVLSAFISLTGACTSLSCAGLHWFLAPPHAHSTCMSVVRLSCFYLGHGVT